MKRKIITVVGARPQFVKASVVSKALAKKQGVEEIFIHTGQHYDPNMSQIFFDELGISMPKYNLAIGSGTHGAQTGRMLEAIETVLLDEKPDGVVVYGDTNSTLAGAIAAVKLDIPIIHVEAGLRSYNRKMPEEINRIATDAVSTLLLAPTPIAVANLKGEGVAESKIVWTGDVMFDSARAAAAAAGAKPEFAKKRQARGFESYFLSTIHRAENTDDPDRLTWIMDTLNAVAKTTPVVMPLHPRTANALKKHDLSGKCGAITFIEPVGYLEMIDLAHNSKAILTDSGGLQKEAFFVDRPAYVFRDETEWTELVDKGWVYLLGDKERALTIADLAGKINLLEGFTRQPLPDYGEGYAAEAVADAITTHLDNSN